MIKRSIAVLIAASLAVSILSCSGGDQLEKARRLMETGELDSARTAIEKSVAQKPDWHEARALLVEVELAAGKPSAALEHVLILLRADYDTSVLHPVLDKCSLQVNIDFVVELLDAEPARGQNLARHVLNSRSYDREVVAAVLPRFIRVAPEDQWPLDIWISFLAKDPVTAWKIAVDMPGDFRGHIICYLAGLDQDKQKSIDTKLLALDLGYPGLVTAAESELQTLLSKEDVGFSPEIPSHYSLNKLNLLLVVNPEQVDSRHLRGLVPDDIVEKINAVLFMNSEPANTAMVLLIALENQGYKPADPENYRKAKLKLLNNFPYESVPTADHFRNLYALDLWSQGLYWYAEYYFFDLEVGQQVIGTIVQVLKTMDPTMARNLELVANPPSPPKGIKEIPQSVYSKWEDFSYMETDFSPDGAQLVYHVDWWVRDDEDDFKTWWIDLQSQKVVLELDGIWSRHWTGDSSKLAFSNQDKVLIYSSPGAGKIQEVNLPPGAEVLGWRDDNTLQLIRPDNQKYTVIKLDVNTGTLIEGVSFNQKPSLTRTGKVGVAWLETGKLVVNIEGVVREYATGLYDGRFHSWLPGDKGLVWDDWYHHGNLVLNFDENTWTIVYLPELYFSQVWRGDREVYARVGLFEGVPGMSDIVILNIDTMEMTHTGIRTTCQISNSHVFNIRRDKSNLLEIYTLD